MLSILVSDLCYTMIPELYVQNNHLMNLPNLLEDITHLVCNIL